MTETEKMINERYNELLPDDKQELYDMFHKEDLNNELKENLEKIIFYKRPPTPEEFLNPAQGWLDEAVIASIYPWVRKDFLEALNQEKKYNIVVEYGATRIGKTELALLMMLYTIVYFHHLREPAMYYGLSPFTELAMYLISFDYAKTAELYLRPLFKKMERSKRFKKTHLKDKVIPLQNELGRDIIVYSTAATTGEITLASGLQLQTGNSDALAFVGANLISGYVSETSFWTEKAGITEEQVFRLYTDIADRIQATVGKDYLTILYLDSSANNSESIIEKHILEELRYREGVHFNWMTRWDALPYKNGKNFPRWHETGKTFQVFLGDNSNPPKIIENDLELKDLSKDLLIEVPIDALNKFKDNINKSIKDIAGRPTQSENKFITDGSLITNIFNNPLLTNIESALVADASVMPEKQIWNQIYSKFFYKNVHGTYTFKRAPRELRYWGADNAFSVRGDVASICCLHKEWSKIKEQIMYVVDFIFVLLPGEKGISLDAPVQLILDARNEGNVATHALFSDTKESAQQKQFLDRHNINLISQSVDRTVVPYQYLLTCMANETIKAGRNIFLKNNLQGLILTRRKDKDGNKKGSEKIDHIIGTTNNKYFGDWEKSTCGVFAKDASDSLCQAVYGASTHEYMPSTIYEDENYRLDNSKEKVKVTIDQLVSTKNFY